MASEILNRDLNYVVFSKDKDAKIGTNIGILKIYNNVKDTDA